MLSQDPWRGPQSSLRPSSQALSSASQFSVRSRALSRREATLLAIAYSFGIAYGFFMIDAPVAADVGSSVFTQLFGLQLNVISYTISNTVGPIAAVFALATLWSALRQLPQEARDSIHERVSGLVHPLHQR